MQDKKPLLGATGSTSTGSTIAPVDGGLYVLSYVCSNWNSASGQLQFLASDNATWVNVGTAATANGSQGPIAIGAAASVRFTITGTPSAAVFAQLDRYQGAP